jgi:Porin PorA
VGNRSRLAVAGVGIFFLAVAALTKFYAYPTLAVAPADQVAHTVSIGQNATIFSAKELKQLDGLTLESKRLVRGDAAAAKTIGDRLHRNVVVYDTAVVTDKPGYTFPDDSSDLERAPLSFVQERVVLDAHTGEAIKWNSANGVDGEYITPSLELNERDFADDDKSVFTGHEGLVLKFPFGTEKKSYKFWDSTTRKAYPIEFKKQETLQGLKVYKFEQVVPNQEIPPADPLKPLKVPGSLVGEPGQDAVEVQRTYQNTRTLWIEPVTGAIIKGQEDQLAELRYKGEPKVVATKVSIGYDDATVKKNVSGAKEQGVMEGGYKAKAAQLNLIGFWVPLLSLLIGLVLVGLAVSSHLGWSVAKARRAAV